MIRYEFVICYEEPQCAYFQCNQCNELISLDYPEAYADAEEVYNNLIKQHKH